mgnify:CR=1 FL=1
MRCVAREHVDSHLQQQVEQGDVLVTDMTDPDWEPVMKTAAAIRRASQQARNAMHVRRDAGCNRSRSGTRIAG